MKKSDEYRQNEHLDEDILEGKNDVLRAKDIIPAVSSTDKDNADILPPAVSEQTEDDAQGEKRKTEIPRFDLDEKIMAPQRRRSSAKRKAHVQFPAMKKKSGPVSERYIAAQPALADAEESRLIAQIVNRDIRKLTQKKNISS